MKKIIQPVEHHVIKERIFYQTEDGKIFNNEIEAENHEKYLDASKVVHKLKACALDIGTFDYWYYVSSEEELNAFFFYYRPSEIFGEVGWNQWFCPKYTDETDCARGYYDLYTLDYIKDQFDKVK